MSTDEELRDLRAEAFHALYRAALTTQDVSQAFAATAEVYERELRKATEERVMTVTVADESLQAVSKARDIAYELRFREPDSSSAREELQGLITELDKVLGPDLVREADPTGKVLRALPFEERKRMLDAVERIAEERGGQPPLIVIVEDEMGPIMEAAAMRKRGVHVVAERDAAAEQMSDYLTQLGVDPDETFEGDSRTTAQILADVALSAGGPVEVGSPEHQASERLTVALMAKGDVARGESE